MSLSRRKKTFTQRLVRLALWGLALACVADALYLYAIMPDWSRYAAGPIPKSSFIMRYELERQRHPDWPPLRWQPVPLRSLPKHLIRAVIVAEDSRFYTHGGFDEEALKEAMEYNLAKGKLVYGASTLSQQTVKNLFLTPSRNPLRKWHELVLTLAMERHLKKSRILEIYLNIAELGRGVYGVEAAAQYYWEIPAADLGWDQAAALVASLPGPVLHNPETNTRFFRRHRATVLARMSAPPPAPDAPATPPVIAPEQPDVAEDIMEEPVPDAPPAVVEELPPEEPVVTPMGQP